MSATSRETQLLETFVTLADSLVVGFDVLDLLQTLVDRSVELFCDNLRRYAAGEPLLNVVDPAAGY